MAVTPTVGERLRRLDDRVLGPPRPESPELLRAACLVSLLLLVAVLLVAVSTGRSSLVAGAGGFLGVALTTGLRWRRAARTSR